MVKDYIIVIININAISLKDVDDIKRVNLRFKLRDDFIYYINFNDSRERLYIFNIFKRKIFKLIYDY